eukprot:gene30297-35284_t
MSSDQAAAIQVVRGRLVDPMGREGSQLPLRPALQTVHDELKGIIDRAAADGSCSSLLLIGERGVGKTLVIERALASVCAHRNNGGDKTVGVVRLSGQLHLEDRAAFQETARQLCGEFKQAFSKAATYDENLIFLRGMLQELHRCMKTVVFVLDEFEKFATKGKQMLLYNLLDVLQHSKVQVKAPAASAAALAPTVRGEGPLVVTPADTPLGVLKEILSLPAACSSAAYSPMYAQRHNQAVTQALSAPAVKDSLRQLYNRRLVPSDLACIAMAAMVEWRAELETKPDAQISATHVHSAILCHREAHDGQSGVIADLSVLQLFLLVAMHRLETKSQLVFNFEMVFDEYRSMRVSSREQFDFQKPASLRAFQELRAEHKGRLLGYVGVQLHTVGMDLEEGLRKHPACPELLIRFFKQEC